MAWNATLLLGDISGFRPEMPNTLLLRVQQDTNLMNTARNELNEILGELTQQDTMLPEYDMSRMFCYFLSTNRWTNLMKTIFHGMDPPIQRNPENTGYSYRFIEERHMNQQQKQRAMELSYNLAGAVWHHLVNNERIYLFGSIHGMNAYLRHLIHYMRQQRIRQEVSDENKDEGHQAEQYPSPPPIKRMRRE